MVNHRLRAAINATGLSHRQLAQELHVSPKTIQRWISQSQVPYPRHRAVITRRLGRPETYFWPSLDEDPDDKEKVGTDEIVRVYPHRSSAPPQLWTTLLDGAERRIDILDHAGLLLVAGRDVVTALAEKAAAGARVRVLLADPESTAVAKRGREEGIGDAARTTLRRAVRSSEPLRDVPGVTVQFHNTTLYASIYQFDDAMLVNTHVYGLSGSHAPLLHLRHRQGGALWETYIMSFERVWQNATPAWPEAYPRSA